MSTGKRFIIIGLSSLYIVSSVLTSYVTAYATAIPVAYTTWEVLEMIFLSFGISFDLATSDLAQEAVSEVEDCFELWMNSNGFDDPEQMRADLEACLEVGKEGVITISNDLWNALKGWVQDFTSVSDDEYVQNMIDAVACPSGSEKYFEMKLNELAGLGSIVILEGAQFVDNEIRVWVTYQDTTGGLSWVWDSRYAKWTLRTNANTAKRDIWYNYSIYYNPSTGKYSYASNDRNPRYIGVSTTGDSMERPSVSYRFIPKNSTVVDSGAFAPDVYFPEESLAYDICYLPGYDLTASIANGAYDVVTSGRTWDGTDVAGDVVITMPDELTTDIPFQDLYDKVIAGDIPYTDVLDDAGVIPVDTTLDRDLVDGGSIAGAIVDSAINDAPTIEDSKDETDENGETVQKDVPMTFDLKKLFPFCIPFDIIDFIGVLSASPVAPCIEYPIQYPTLNGMETYNLKIDLSKFDKVASLLRKMETLVFIVGLAGITRNHMIRG